MSSELSHIIADHKISVFISTDFGINKEKEYKTIFEFKYSNDSAV